MVTIPETIEVHLEDLPQPAGIEHGFEPGGGRAVPILHNAENMATGLAGGLPDGLRPGEGKRQRFFDDDVEPQLQRRHRLLGVKTVRGADAGDIGFDSGLNGGGDGRVEWRPLQSMGPVKPLGWEDVHHADQFRLRVGGDERGVAAADVAEADDQELYFVY